MSVTNIFPSQPSYIANTDPSAGWAISGDNNAATCVGTSGDSKLYGTDIWDRSIGDVSDSFYGFGIGSIPTYIVVNSVTVYSVETVSGSSPGTWKTQIGLSGANWIDAIASHTAGTSSSGSASRPGGGSWTRADLANIYLRQYVTGWGSYDRDCWLDQWYVAVDWSYITPTTVQTDAADNITVSGARIKGTVNSNGDLGGTYRLVYGSSSGSYDNPSWTTVTNGSSNQYTRTLSGLNAGQTYYFRVEYKNSGGTQTNGSELTFKTLSGGCMILVD